MFRDVLEAKDDIVAEAEGVAGAGARVAAGAAVHAGAGGALVRLHRAVLAGVAVPALALEPVV